MSDEKEVETNNATPAPDAESNEDAKDGADEQK